MKVMKCEDCGARLEYDKETGKVKCPYCGALHSANEDAEKKIDNDVKAINDFVDKVETNIQENSDMSGVNWIVFVLLLFVCWPVAIIYLVVAAKKKK